MDWWPLTSRCCIIHQFFSLTQKKKKRNRQGLLSHPWYFWPSVETLGRVRLSRRAHFLRLDNDLEKTLGTCFYWAGFFFVHYTPLESSWKYLSLSILTFIQVDRWRWKWNCFHFTRMYYSLVPLGKCPNNNWQNRLLYYQQDMSTHVLSKENKKT